MSSASRLQAGVPNGRTGLMIRCRVTHEHAGQPGSSPRGRARTDRRGQVAHRRARSDAAAWAPSTKGTNTSIGKKVALKFIDAEFARQPDVASRFQREAEAASLVESAHIVHIFDSGHDRRRHSLHRDGAAPRRGPPGEAERGSDACRKRRRFTSSPRSSAASTARTRRASSIAISSRTTSSSSIATTIRFFAKIVDFGISKMTRRSGASGNLGPLTRQGVVLGTPFYMSPEQAQALADVDVRTDLWSVGAILYECLAGGRRTPATRTSRSSSPSARPTRSRRPDASIRASQRRSPRWCIGR